MFTITVWKSEKHGGVTYRDVTAYKLENGFLRITVPDGAKPTIPEHLFINITDIQSFRVSMD